MENRLTGEAANNYKRIPMKERRAGKDRRRADRRRRQVFVSLDRRAGQDRRRAFRRDADIETDVRKMLKRVRAGRRRSSRKKKRPSPEPRRRRRRLKRP